MSFCALCVAITYKTKSGNYTLASNKNTFPNGYQLLSNAIKSIGYDYSLIVLKCKYVENDNQFVLLKVTVIK